MEICIMAEPKKSKLLAYTKKLLTVKVNTIYATIKLKKTEKQLN